jgi:hypothetical protein
VKSSATSDPKMRRYFFDLKFEGQEASGDEEGTVLLDMTAAQIEASRTLCDFAKEIIGRGRDLRSLAVIVRDEDGPVLEAHLDFKIKRLN